MRARDGTLYQVITMTEKKYIVAPDRTVTTATKVYAAGEEIITEDEHLQPLLKCGAVVEVEQAEQPKGKKKGAE